GLLGMPTARRNRGQAPMRVGGGGKQAKRLLVFHASRVELAALVERVGEQRMRTGVERSRQGGRAKLAHGGFTVAAAQVHVAGDRTEVPQGEALDQALNELEKKIERVRTLYEQYFMGIEKMEPQVARKDVTRTLLVYAQQHIRNTGQRFRFHSMQQKWNIYIT